MNNKSLVVSNPFLDFARKFFDNDFDYYPSILERKNNGLTNVSENENEYLIELTAPGLKKEDIKIELEDDVLKISSDIEDKREETNDGYYRREFYKSSFSRSFTIPKSIKKEDISASMDNGILFVTIPKMKEEEKVDNKLKITIK